MLSLSLPTTTDFFTAGARRFATMKPLQIRRARLRTAACRLMVLAALVTPLAGCQRLQARMEFKKGNTFYGNESYRPALEQFQKGLAMDPSATFVWRSVGLTAMALHKPGVEDEENTRYADIAIDAFRKYQQAYPEDAKVDEYLITVLMNAGRNDEALKLLEEKEKAKPNDPALRQGIVNLLIKSGRLDEAMARARRTTPPDPVAFYGIGVAAWDQAYNDPEIDATRREAVVDLGLEATKQALDLKPDYFEAMAYYNLLYREKAKLALDPEAAQRYYALADEWTQKAVALRQAQEKKDAAAANQTGS